MEDAPTGESIDAAEPFEIVVTGERLEVEELLRDLVAAGTEINSQDIDSVRGVATIGEQVVAGLVVVGVERTVRAVIAIWKARGGRRTVVQDLPDDGVSRSKG